ncbi:hypothetical protein [Geodermatophilus sp. SYSU D00696]
MPARAEPTVDPLQDLAAGAVDVLDVAARLEANGVSDRTAAARHGRTDVFALAAAVYRVGQARVGSELRRARTPVGLDEAGRRGLLLVAGVLLAAAALSTLQVDARLVWTAGATGWIGGQVVAAVAWSRLGWGEGPAGRRRAGGMTLLVLAVAPLTPIVLAHDLRVAAVAVALCLVWTAYASAVSVLVCARRTVGALVAVWGALLVVAVVSVLPESWTWSPSLTLGGATTASLVVVLLGVRTVVGAGGPALPGRADWRAAAPAAAQAFLLATSLLTLLQTVPEQSATPLVTASVVGAAAADPVIALLRARLQTSAARLYVMQAAARKARHAAVLAAGSTAAFSALAAALVVLALQAGNPEWPMTVVTAAAFTSMATTAAALTAFGVPWRAVLAAAMAAVYASSALVYGAHTAAVIFPLALFGAIAILLHRVSDPRVVA